MHKSQQSDSVYCKHCLIADFYAFLYNSSVVFSETRIILTIFEKPVSLYYFGAICFAAGISFTFVLPEKTKAVQLHKDKPAYKIIKVSLAAELQLMPNYFFVKNSISSLNGNEVLVRKIRQTLVNTQQNILDFFIFCIF